jgi:tripartite-type tricarboxylate transporter receptor subunit TctC
VGAHWRAVFIPRVSDCHQTGGNGRRAAATLRRHPADDELLLVTPGSVLTMLPHTDRPPAYDPFRDLTPICTIGRMNLALAVGPGVPASVRTVEAFIAWCRWQHEAILFANAGFGSFAHFLTVLLGNSAGLALEPVPYRTELASVRAAAGGEVGAVLAREWAVLPYARAGRVRVLATSGTRRSRFQSQTPTFVETGYPMLERSDWLGAFMPSGVPDDRAWALAGIIDDSLRESEVRDVMLRLSFDPAGGSPEVLADTLRRDHDFWGPVVRASGYVTGGG